MKKERLDLNNSNNLFKTSEFILICVLSCLGIPIEALERDCRNPDKVIAVFKKTESMDKILEDFWKRQIKVEPISFWATVREIKSRIRSEAEYDY
ncbi:MAG: DUF5659 domain-containing protein [Candidatus Pacebacteria bacterium]|nr:DUF5659 domain-containing protein [Candidatus Paceibacterota bacterium]